MDNISGLTEAQAHKLLKTYGHNELPYAGERSVFIIAGSIIREPMFLLLVGCGIIYLLLGSKLEAQMLLGFVLIMMGITFYNERKSENALRSLRNLSSPRAIVIRDGMEKRISGRDVVPGDIVVLKEGDRVPADGELITCSNLYIDESLITGESVPVRKKILGSEITDSSDSYSRSSVFAGSL
ncbi:MAG: HAD-IC family P-type ATPase, partial [Candidatus Omnitrophica bacterium]|nr:HAD-IC family P-type ATPase [Candidatus Omnitrophota bacterium]